ncbi:hypothetical protein HOY80DRAFT_431737 [Tuber brumale]|nr:hypothetical protein HOY80DRAFT_431737 [Tuber brumale]
MVENTKSSINLLEYQPKSELTCDYVIMLGCSTGTVLEYCTPAGKYWLLRMDSLAFSVRGWRCFPDQVCPVGASGGQVQYRCLCMMGTRDRCGFCARTTVGTVLTTSTTYWYLITSLILSVCVCVCVLSCINHHYGLKYDNLSFVCRKFTMLSQYSSIINLSLQYKYSSTRVPTRFSPVYVEQATTHAFETIYHMFTGLPILCLWTRQRKAEAWSCGEWSIGAFC